MHVRTGAPYATSAPTDRHSGTSETESASTRHSSLEKGVGSLKLHSSPPRNRFAAAVTLAKPVGAGLYDAPISRHCATSNDESASTMHSVYLKRAGGVGVGALQREARRRPQRCRRVAAESAELRGALRPRRQVVAASELEGVVAAERVRRRHRLGEADRRVKLVGRHYGRGAERRAGGEGRREEHHWAVAAAIKN